MGRILVHSAKGCSTAPRDCNPNDPLDATYPEHATATLHLLDQTNGERLSGLYIPGTSTAILKSSLADSDILEAAGEL